MGENLGETGEYSATRASVSRCEVYGCRTARGGVGLRGELGE